MVMLFHDRKLGLLTACMGELARFRGETMYFDDFLTIYFIF